MYIQKFKSLGIICLVIIMTIFTLFYSNFSVFASTGEQLIITETSVESFELNSNERKMLNLLNSARAERDLPPLKLSEQLTILARLKAEDMAENNFFAHHSPNFGSPFEMMKDFEIEFSTAGENIASNPTLIGAHNRLMQSAQHRANVLNKNFDSVGIGIASGDGYDKIIVQMFTGR